MVSPLSTVCFGFLSPPSRERRPAPPSWEVPATPSYPAMAFSPRYAPYGMDPRLARPTGMAFPGAEALGENPQDFLMNLMKSQLPAKDQPAFERWFKDPATQRKLAQIQALALQGKLTPEAMAQALSAGGGGLPPNMDLEKLQEVQNMLKSGMVAVPAGILMAVSADKLLEIANRGRFDGFWKLFSKIPFLKRWDERHGRQIQADIAAGRAGQTLLSRIDGAVTSEAILKDYLQGHLGPKGAFRADLARVLTDSRGQAILKRLEQASHPVHLKQLLEPSAIHFLPEAFQAEAHSLGEGFFYRHLFKRFPKLNKLLPRRWAEGMKPSTLTLGQLENATAQAGKRIPLCQSIREAQPFLTATLSDPAKMTIADLEAFFAKHHVMSKANPAGWATTTIGKEIRRVMGRFPRALKSVQQSLESIGHEYQFMQGLRKRGVGPVGRFVARIGFYVQQTCCGSMLGKRGTALLGETEVGTFVNKIRGFFDRLGENFVGRVFMGLFTVGSGMMAYHKAPKENKGKAFMRSFTNAMADWYGFTWGMNLMTKTRLLESTPWARRFFSKALLPFLPWSRRGFVSHLLVPSITAGIFGGITAFFTNRLFGDPDKGQPAKALPQKQPSVPLRKKRPQEQPATGSPQSPPPARRHKPSQPERSPGRPHRQRPYPTKSHPSPSMSPFEARMVELGLTPGMVSRSPFQQKGHRHNPNDDRHRLRHFVDEEVWGHHATESL